MQYKGLTKVLPKPQEKKKKKKKPAVPFFALPLIRKTCASDKTVAIAASSLPLFMSVFLLFFVYYFNSPSSYKNADSSSRISRIPLYFTGYVIGFGLDFAAADIILCVLFLKTYFYFTCSAFMFFCVRRLVLPFLLSRGLF